MRSFKKVMPQSPGKPRGQSKGPAPAEVWPLSEKGAATAEASLVPALGPLPGSGPLLCPWSFRSHCACCHREHSLCFP